MISPNNSSDWQAQLAVYRQQIDQIDEQLLDLFNQRARCAQHVGDLKAEHGELTVYRPERESSVLRRIIQLNTGPLPSHSVAYLFREVMSACLALEHPLTIGYLKMKEQYGQQAAQKHFGHGAETVPYEALSDLINALETDRLSYVVVAVDQLMEYCASNAWNGMMENTCLICGEVFGKQMVPPSGKDKTTVLMSAKQAPEEVLKLWTAAADDEMRVTRFEFRPLKENPLEHLFLMELDLHSQQEERLARALHALQEQATAFRVLGSYPVAVL
jgi:chorismate mutase-like protein